MSYIRYALYLISSRLTRCVECHHVNAIFVQSEFQIYSEKKVATNAHPVFIIRKIQPLIIYLTMTITFSVLVFCE